MNNVIVTVNHDFFLFVAGAALNNIMILYINSCRRLFLFRFAEVRHYSVKL